MSDQNAFDVVIVGGSYAGHCRICSRLGHIGASLPLLPGLRSEKTGILGNGEDGDELAKLIAN